MPVWRRAKGCLPFGDRATDFEKLGWVGVPDDIGGKKKRDHDLQVQAGRARWVAQHQALQTRPRATLCLPT